MRNPGKMLVVMLALVSVCAGEGEDAFPLITKRVQSWVDRGYYPGCSVWIAKGEQVLYQRSFGNATPATEVFIASAGKWLAAAAIMAVVDEGKLSLDDPVERWLPEFRTDPKGKATLRQLLSHTSGYPPYQPDDRPRDNYQTCAESVAQLLPLVPHFKPGEEFEYGGLAMQVAGRMAEMAAGMNWEAIFQEKIARPLAMTNTRFTPVDSGHAPMLGGAAVSSLADYQKFLTLIDGGGCYQGQRLLSENSIKELGADQVRGARVKRDEFVERVRGNTHSGIYGLGEWREELDERGNATLISSPSWAGTYPWIDKKTGIRGLIIAHVAGPAVARDQFSGFWTSPVLAKMVRAELGWMKPDALPDFGEGIIPADGADLAYEAAGSGEPVILLHGHSFDRRMWNPQFAELAGRYRVIRYDLRGYGLSDLPVEGRNFTHAADLLRVMDYLHLKKAHVVGLSLGAFVTTDFLALHPDRLLSATIASGGIHEGPGSSTLVMDAASRTKRLVEIESLRKEGIVAEKSRWTELLVGTAGPRGPLVRPVLKAMIGDWSAWQPLHIEPSSILGRPAFEMISRKKPVVPVLLLIGGTESSDHADLLTLQRALPLSKLITIPDAGHLSNLEQPAAFNSELFEFLAHFPPQTPQPRR